MGMLAALYGEDFFDMSPRDQEWVEGMALRRYKNDSSFMPDDAEKIEQLYDHYLGG